MTEIYSNKREESPVKVRQYLKADVWSREGLSPQGGELVDWATGVWGDDFSSILLIIGETASIT